MTNAEVKEEAAPKAMLTDTSYNVLKDFVTMYIPALITLYSGLAVLWEWPNSDKVIASAALVLTFLGVIVKVASSRYAKQDPTYDGSIVLNETDPDKDVFRIELEHDLQSLGDKKDLLIKVNNLLKPPSQ